MAGLARLWLAAGLRPAWLVAAGGHELDQPMHSVPFGQLVVLLVVAIVAVVRFEVFCLTDLVHAQQTGTCPARAGPRPASSRSPSAASSTCTSTGCVEC